MKSDTLADLEIGLDLLSSALDDAYRLVVATEARYVERFIPLGAGQPLPDAPEDIDPQATLEADLKRWDRRRPDEKGLLDAEAE